MELRVSQDAWSCSGQPAGCIAPPNAAYLPLQARASGGTPGANMSFFDSLSVDERLSIAPYMTELSWSAGTCILEQGTLGDELYLIDGGRVRLELHTAELDSDSVLDHLETGQVLGEFSLFDRGLRSASAYADTDVLARRLTRASLDALCEEHPKLGIALLTYLAQDFTYKLRQMDQRLGTYLVDGQVPAWVDEQVAAAARAQEAWSARSDEAVDAVIREIADRKSVV